MEQDKVIPMPVNAIDLSGERYGKLLVISYAKSQKNKAYWYCICDCGNDCVVRSDKLRQGLRDSCGCLSLKKEAVRTNVQKIKNYENALYAVLNIAFEQNIKDILEITIRTLQEGLVDKKYQQDIQNGIEIFKFSKSNGE